MVHPNGKPMSRHDELDEEELVGACRRGERWAQRALFERHNAPVFRALLALTGDPTDAEDLVQETFLKAYGAIGGFRGHSSVRTWLLRIATNAFYEERRRMGTRRRHLDRVQSESRAESLRVVRTARNGNPEQHELRDLVVQGLRALRVADRTVLTLHDIEGYRYAEIAEILDVAPGTVGSRLSRARERLSVAMRDLLGLRAEETLTLEHLYGQGRGDVRDEIGGHPSSPRDKKP